MEAVCGGATPPGKKRLALWDDTLADSRIPAAHGNRPWLRSAPILAPAKDCRVSERQLRRFFRLKFGKSPRAWLAACRLARGAASLQQAALVKEAAGHAGFKDPAHFTRLFTQYYGVPPSEFRLADAA